MNSTTEQLQPPPQPHRPSTSCDRHPEEHFTGFCPSCLCERLAVLEPSSSASSSSRKPPPIPTTTTAAAALKAIFKPNSSSDNKASSSSSSSSFFPELRRTKSFSASKNEGFSGIFEPQRKSCDVRVRSTLWSLFYQDDPSKKLVDSEIVQVVEPSRLSSSSVRGGGGGPVVFEDQDSDNNTESGDIIRVLDEQQPIILTARNSNANPIEEILEEDEEEEEDEGIVIEPQIQEEEEVEVIVKPMKDHIDLDSQTKKGSGGRDFKEIAGSFWSAASVFSKKLQKWRQKQKLNNSNSKKRRNGGSATLPVEKPIGRQFRETQSEIADYGFGRRSCDTDPRFSLDAGRISFDDPRYSFDEPRASWDGYLIGSRNFPRMPTMLSVVEDAPVNVVLRSDAQIPVEEQPRNSIHEDDTQPGGSAQTRDYYSDSSSRRRKSLDRSNSIRKTAAAVVAEIDELKSNASVVSNSKVSPATTTAAADFNYINGPKLVVPDRDLNSNSNSLRDDCSETFDMGFRDNVVGNGERKGAKKSRRWSKAWNIWGFIHRRSVNKDEDEDRYSRVNGVERSFSESWPELRGERNNNNNNPKILRSNSSVSWRNSNGFGGGGGSFSSARKSNVETNGHGSKKKRDEFVLERNRSARYSPSSIDNGLLRFYLTPLRGSRRGGWGKSKSSHAQSIARSVLRLY